MTRSSILVRIGALTAVAGGILRAFGSFAPAYIESAGRLEALYITIDVCLAAGLLAFYSRSAGRLRLWASAGFVLALAGIAAIRANRFVSAADLYPIGALAVACGVVILAANAWLAHQIAGWVPLTFVLSTVVGLLGTVIPGASALFVFSGVTFGIAFAGLGAATWTSSAT